jgi:hypothetical protein
LQRYNDGGFNTATGIYTVATSGLYQVNFSVSTNMDYINWSVYLNGSIILYTANSTCDTVGSNTTGNVLLYLDAASAISLRGDTNCNVFTVGGGSAGNKACATTFSAVLLA